MTMNVCNSTSLATEMTSQSTQSRPTALSLPCRICHIAVGTPGRICALLERGDLVTPKLKLLVLDDAEALNVETFRDDIIWLYSKFLEGSQVRQRAR